MAYRRILVPLRGGTADSHVLKAAFEVATAFGSHVHGVYVKPDPDAVLRYLGKGVSARMRQEISDAAHDDAKRAADAAHTAVIQAAKAVDAPLQPQAKAGDGIGASFHVRQGPFEDVITEEARLFDLAVFELCVESKDVEMRAALESVLLNSRRPLLLVPGQVPGQVTGIVGAKTVIGWDGGATAANAVLSAVPLLKRAAAIEILNVRSGPANGVHMDRVRDYLRLQGQSAVEHGVNPGSQGTAAALLEAAQKSGAGLLVVGGYGHSRLREFVLGGVTRYLFDHAALPVFMAH